MRRWATEAEWRQALQSLGELSAQMEKWEDVLLVAARLEKPGSQLPVGLCGLVVRACVQLGLWDKGRSGCDALPAAAWMEQGWKVQEAYWALCPKPRQGLKGLLVLAGEGHPVGAMAARGLLATCETGV
jgi:hypothetical protein